MENYVLFKLNLKSPKLSISSSYPIDASKVNKDQFLLLNLEDKDNSLYPAKSGPKISVITVTYNSAHTVADTLYSVKNQSYSNVEHIVVDGNSSDKTSSIIQSFPHVSKFISENDNGIYDAINKGIEMATGEIIGILHSSDVYANENVLQNVAEYFRTKSVDTLYADLNYVNEQNTNKVVRRWKSGEYKRSKFSYGWMPPHPTFFVKKEVYEKVGQYNAALKNSADYEMMLRILFKHCYTTTYLPSTIVKMRVGGVSNCSLKNRMRANKEDRIAWKMNNIDPHFFTLYMKPLRKLFQFVNFNFFIRIAILCIKD